MRYAVRIKNPYSKSYKFTLFYHSSLKCIILKNFSFLSDNCLQFTKIKRNRFLKRIHINLHFRNFFQRSCFNFKTNVIVFMLYETEIFEAYSGNILMKICVKIFFEYCDNLMCILHLTLLQFISPFIGIVFFISSLFE